MVIDQDIDFADSLLQIKSTISFEDKKNSFSSHFEPENTSNSAHRVCCNFGRSIILQAEVEL